MTSRVSSSTPSPTTNTSTDAPSWSRALLIAYGRSAACRCVGMRIVRVDHAIPASRRSSAIARTTAAPSAALDFGGGPPVRWSTNNRSSVQKRKLARSVDALRLAASIRSKDRDVVVPAAREHCHALLAVQLDPARSLRRATRSLEHLPPAVAVGERPRGGTPPRLHLGNCSLRLRDGAHHLERDGEVVRARGPTTMSTSSCGFPQPTRTVRSPATAPSLRSRAIAASSSTPGW